MKIEFDVKVKRKLKKISQKDLKLYEIFLNKISILRNNPAEKSLHIHKLSGRKVSAWSFLITYSVRAVFIYIKKGGILIIDIGSHDEVY